MSRLHISMPRLLIVIVVAAAGSALLIGQSARAAQAAPKPSVSYGWWTQTALGLTAPSPPDVPANGMLIENLIGAPTALSAVRFTVPRGARARMLTLSISGTPFITQPPVVCPATSTFTHAEAGPWSRRPHYDCRHQVRGRVNSAKTQIRFPVTGLAKHGGLSLVVLAGGPADRVVLRKPTGGALGVRRTTQPVPSPTQRRGPPSTPTPAPPTAPAFTAPASAQTIPVPTAPAISSATRGAAAPEVAGTPSPATTPIGTAVATTGLSSTRPGDRRTVGTILGVTLLILCILYWANGFGAVQLRTSAAARRTKPGS